MKHTARRYVGIALAAALPSLWTAKAQAEPLPTARAAEFQQAPVLDGHLKDRIWRHAEAFTLSRVMYREDGVPTVRTDVRLGVDADYIGARSEFPEGEAIRAERTGPHAMDVGRDDHLEIFIRPSEDALFPYFHFLLGAGGARREARIFSTEGRDPEWSVAWRTATAVKGKVWTAEIAIPLYAFGDDRLPGQPMRFSIVHCKVRGSHGRETEYSTWAPVGGKNSHFGFHDPAHFGYLAGLENRAVKAACAPTILRAVNAGLYREDQGRFSYTANVMLANRGGAGGRTELICEDVPNTGAPTRTALPVDVPAHGSSEVHMTVPVATPGNRTARVILAENETTPGTLWTSVERMDALTALVAYPSLNYYSGEPEGRLTVGTVYPDAVFEAHTLNLAVTVMGPAGEAVLKQGFSRTANQGVVISLPVGRWRPGTYPVSVDLRAAEDMLVASVSATIRVVPPPPEGVHASKLDHERMCVLKDGEPFFIYSIMSYTYGGAGARDAFGGDWGEKYAQGGINLITSWNNWCAGREARTPWGPEHDGRLAQALAAEHNAMDAAYQARGLFVAPRVVNTVVNSHRAASPEGHKLLMDKLPAVINGLKANPGLLMYYGKDEPGVSSELALQAARVRELDPYHLQVASCCQYVSAALYQTYDFYFIHHYPAPGGINGLASLIREGSRTAKLVRAPMVATVQGQRTTFSRELLPQERLALLVLPVINGAKGLCFFAPDEQWATHPVTWRVMAYAGRLYRALAPILVHNPPPQHVQATAVTAGAPADLPPLPKPRTLFDPSWEGTFIPVNEVQMPVIQARIWDKPQGGELMLVCNSTPHPATARFALSTVAAATQGGASVREYFSGRELLVSDGRFTIDFKPYGVRVLETLGSARRPGGPVALGIAYTLPESPPSPVGANLAVNGDLDSDDLSGWQRSGSVTLVTNESHTGIRSLRLEGVMSNQMAAVGQKIMLQPNTRHRLSVWMKSAIRSGRRSASCFVHFPKESGLGKSGVSHVDRTAPEDDWREHAITVTTRDQPAQASFYCRMPPYVDGHIWVDDMRVEDLRAKRQQRATFAKPAGAVPAAVPGGALMYSRADDLAQMADPRNELPPLPGENILKNAGFEEYTLPQLPDHWMTHLYMRGFVGQDGKGAQQGRYGVRVMPTRSHYSLSQAWWNWEPGRTYTFSVWARAERVGPVLRLLAMDGRGHPGNALMHDVPLTADWQRYTWSFQAPEKTDPNAWRNAGRIGLWSLDLNDKRLETDVRPTASAPIWVDAAQLELGDTATDFKADSYKAPAFDPKWFSDDVFKELEKSPTR